MSWPNSGHACRQGREVINCIKKRAYPALPTTLFRLTTMRAFARETLSLAV